MKRALLSFIAFIACFYSAKGQQLSINDVEVCQGETVSLDLTINTNGGSYGAFQFEMHFPSDGFTTTGNTTVSPSWSGGIFEVGPLTARQGRGAGLSLTDTSIPNGNIVVGTIEISVDDAVAVGNYDVTISNFNFLNGSTYTPVENQTFTIKVVETHKVTLNEDSEIAPTNATDVDVLVKRKIYANEWNTLCLPFNMNATQVKNVFGSDVKLAELRDWQSYNDNEDKVIAITVSFRSITAITANRPCIIKTSTDVDEFSVDNVDLQPEATPQIEVGTRRVEKGSMTGTYVANTIVPNKSLFLSDNKFWYSVGTTRMKGYRAYFEFYEVLDALESSGARVSLRIDDETSSVKGVTDQGDKGIAPLYDLQGRKVMTPRKGLYIRNGKILKKD